MKKLLFILLLFILLFVIACVGCKDIDDIDNYNNSKSEDATYGWNYLDIYIKYRIANIDEHQYLIFRTQETGYSTPICVIHSESCPCKNKKK